MKKVIRGNSLQIWENICRMNKSERAMFIKWVNGLSPVNGGWIDYSMRSVYIEMLKNSECYYNGLGYSTPVRGLKG